MSQKNVPPLVCYNFVTRERIFTFFGRNVTDKVSNQKTLYCASALPGKTGKQENRIFHLNAVSVHCQNSTSRSLISSVFLTHDSYSRCCMTPKYCNQCIQLRAVGEHGSGKGSRDRRSSWTVLHAQCMCSNALSS